MPQDKGTGQKKRQEGGSNSRKGRGKVGWTSRGDGRRGDGGGRKKQK